MKTAIIVTALCLIAIPAFALSTWETGTVSTSTASGLTTTVSGSTNMNSCYCTTETAPIRFRFDGLSSPTTTVGHLAATGSSIKLQNVYEVKNFKMISSQGTVASYSCTCSE